MADKKRDKFKITTPEFPGSFVWLAKPRVLDGKAKFGLTIVVPKENEDFWTEVRDKMKACAIDRWGKVPEGDFFSAIKDGDKPQGKKKVLRPEWKGCFAISATTTEKVDVIDKQGNVIIDGSELYSGAIYMAVVRAGWWEHPTSGDGVSLFLDNVLRVGDGKKISGRADPSDDFAAFIEKEESGGPLD
jgi:hypothetical protein